MSNLRLDTAVDNDDTDAVCTPINQGVDVNASVEVREVTPLHVATHYSNQHILELLMKANADVNVLDNGDTGIFKNLTIGSMDLEVVRILVDIRSFDVNSEIGSHVSLLQYAVINSNAALVKFLLSRGANTKVRSRSWTPLHFACYSRTIDWKSNFEIIKSLLQYGADVDSIDNHRRTPLMLALLNKYWLKVIRTDTSILQLLLAYSDVNKVDIRGRNVSTMTLNLDALRVIMKHLAKLQALGIPVSSDILESTKNEEYFQSCQEELRAAKRTKLHNSWVSYFNLLVDSKLKLKNYAGNQVLVKDFNSRDVEKMFPTYGADMRRRVDKAIKQREVFDRSAVVLSNCLPILDPMHLIIRGILDCLITSKNLCLE